MFSAERSGAETATYEQIKDYVREQTGFRVSTLYISQVKRKCGLEVGESYYKPKSEDEKYEFEKVQEIIGQDYKEAIRILEEN